MFAIGAATSPSSSLPSGSASGSSGLAGTAGGSAHEQTPQQPAIRVLFAVQLGEGERARALALAPGGRSEVQPGAASFPAGARARGTKGCTRGAYVGSRMLALVCRATALDGSSWRALVGGITKRNVVPARLLPRASSTPARAGSQPLEISLPPMDPIHGQFHVSAIFCSERERPLRIASTRSSLAAVAMHMHGTIIPNYLDSVQAPVALVAAAADAVDRAAEHAASGAHVDGSSARRPALREHEHHEQQEQLPQHPRAQPLPAARHAPLPPQHATPMAHAPSQQVGFVPQGLPTATDARACAARSDGGAPPPSCAHPGAHAHSLLTAGLHAAIGANAGAHPQAAPVTVPMIGAGTSPPLGMEHVQLCRAATAAVPAAAQGSSPQLAGAIVSGGAAGSPFGSHAHAACVPLSGSHVASSPVAIPSQAPSSIRIASVGTSPLARASSSADAPGDAGAARECARADGDHGRARVGSWEQGVGGRVPVRIDAIGRATSDAAARVSSHDSPMARERAHSLRTHGAAQHAFTPPQAVPVHVLGRDATHALGADEDYGGLFRPVSGASSPPLFGTSPPALAMSGSAYLLPSAMMLASRGGINSLIGAQPPMGASPGSSASPHDGCSSKRSSCRGSPFLEHTLGGAPIGGSGGLGGGGGRHSPAPLSAAHMYHVHCAAPRAPAAYASSAPAGGAPPLHASEQAFAFARDELDGLTRLHERDDEAAMLGVTLHASSLSRSVISLSRDLDALRRSLNLGHAAEHTDDDLPTPSSHGVSRRGSLEPHAHTHVAPGACGAQPAREWARRGAASGADAFDEAGLIFPFAPVCNDHCHDE